jgi:hypothetical protein
MVNLCPLNPDGTLYFAWETNVEFAKVWTLFPSHKKREKISAQAGDKQKALLKQSAEVGDGDYGEAVQGSTVADESPSRIFRT